MAFNQFAAGSKTYRGVSSAPHIGPHTALEGYAERDKKYDTRRKNNAILRRLKAQQDNKYLSADWLSAPMGRSL